MNTQKAINQRRERRRFHVRNRIHGTPEQPRLSVHRSLQHISCQVIDDVSGRTLVSASTKDRTVREAIRYGGNKEAAAAVGKLIAEKSLAAGIRRVRFDRGYCKYHGRVAALADAARAAGLEL